MIVRWLYATIALAALAGCGAAAPTTQTSTVVIVRIE